MIYTVHISFSDKALSKVVHFRQIQWYGYESYLEKKSCNVQHNCRLTWYKCYVNIQLMVVQISI